MGLQENTNYENLSWEPGSLTVSRVSDQEHLPAYVKIADDVAGLPQTSGLERGSVLKVQGVKTFRRIFSLPSDSDGSVHSSRGCVLSVNYPGHVRVVSSEDGPSFFSTVRDLLSEKYRPRSVTVNKTLSLSEKGPVIPAGTLLTLSGVVKRCTTEGLVDFLICKNNENGRTVGLQSNTVINVTSVPDTGVYSLSEVLDKYVLPQKVRFLPSDGDLDPKSLCADFSTESPVLLVREEKSKYLVCSDNLTTQLSRTSNAYFFPSETGAARSQVSMRLPADGSAFSQCIGGWASSSHDGQFDFSVVSDPCLIEKKPLNQVYMGSVAEFFDEAKPPLLPRKIQEEGVSSEGKAGQRPGPAPNVNDGDYLDPISRPQMLQLAGRMGLMSDLHNGHHGGDYGPKPLHKLQAQQSISSSMGDVSNMPKLPQSANLTPFQKVCFRILKRPLRKPKPKEEKSFGGACRSNSFESVAMPPSETPPKKVPDDTYDNFGAIQQDRLQRAIAEPVAHQAQATGDSVSPQREPVVRSRAFSPREDTRKHKETWVPRANTGDAEKNTLVFHEGNDGNNRQGNPVVEPWHNVSLDEATAATAPTTDPVDMKTRSLPMGASKKEPYRLRAPNPLDMPDMIEQEEPPQAPPSMKDRLLLPKYPTSSRGDRYVTVDIPRRAHSDIGKRSAPAINATSNVQTPYQPCLNRNPKCPGIAFPQPHYPTDSCSTQVLQSPKPFQQVCPVDPPGPVLQPTARGPSVQAGAQRAPPPLADELAESIPPPSADPCSPAVLCLDSHKEAASPLANSEVFSPTQSSSAPAVPPKVQPRARLRVVNDDDGSVSADTVMTVTLLPTSVNHTGGTAATGASTTAYANVTCVPASKSGKSVAAVGRSVTVDSSDEGDDAGYVPPDAWTKQPPSHSSKSAEQAQVITHNGQDEGRDEDRARSQVGVAVTSPEVLRPTANLSVDAPVQLNNSPAPPSPGSANTMGKGARPIPKKRSTTRGKVNGTAAPQVRVAPTLRSSESVNSNGGNNTADSMVCNPLSERAGAEEVPAQYQCLEDVPTDLCGLGVSELATCLQLHKLDGVAAAFRRDDVDGSLFMSMPEEMLRCAEFAFNHLEIYKLLQIQKGWKRKP